MIAELNNDKAMAADLKTSLDSRTACVRCLKVELARLKAAESEEARDASRRVAAYQSVLLDVHQ